MDELARLERLYGSVPEYNRVSDETRHLINERHRAELLKTKLIKEVIEFLNQRGYRQKSGLDYPDKCGHCHFRTQILHLDPEDDIGTFFCLDSYCFSNSPEVKPVSTSAPPMSDPVREEDGFPF
jgi:hypothetical protein